MQKITVELGGLVCKLSSAETAVIEQWHNLFDSRFQPQNMQSIDLFVELSVVAKLPPLPPESPIATEQFPLGGYLYAFSQEDFLTLYLTRSRGVVLYMKGLTDKTVPSVKILIRETAVADGSLEDVTLFAMAPYLRKNGFFLVHAFAAAQEDGAVLFVGKSGSGKTTTGLRLLAGGWHFLANDVALLHPQDETVWAFPSPGCFNIHPNTFELLPDLQIPQDLFNEVYGKFVVPAADLMTGDEGKRPFPVRHICLLQRQAGNEHTLIPLSPAVALAQLMEESIDRWDTQTFLAHVEALEQVVSQASCFQLKLGWDVSTLPSFLETNLSQVV